MKKPIFFVLFILFATLVIALTVPQPLPTTSETQTLESYDVLLITLEYNKGKINIDSLQITKGFSQKRKDLTSGDYALEIVDDFGNIISSQLFDKPKIIYESIENNQITGALVMPDKDIITLSIEVNKDAKELIIKEIKTNKIILKENMDWLKEA